MRFELISINEMLHSMGVSFKLSVVSDLSIGVKNPFTGQLNSTSIRLSFGLAAPPSATRTLYSPRPTRSMSQR